MMTTVSSVKKSLIQTKEWVCEIWFTVTPHGSPEKDSRL